MKYSFPEATLTRKASLEMDDIYSYYDFYLNPFWTNILKPIILIVLFPSVVSDISKEGEVVLLY